ncbi:MAG: hypothetical protein K2G55_04500 [Lachnospiraceae bacterium]|nr:hypothetical protein [Lachnospiraceae bacterium]
MPFELSLRTAFIIIPLIGAIIPLIGIFVLMGKEQNNTSTNLMVANIGCLIMNGSYYLMIRTNNPSEAILALKMEYLGNFLFYFFFIKFILAYMQIDTRHKIVKVFTNIWLAFEAIALIIMWDDKRREMAFGQMAFGEDARFGYHFASADDGVVYKIRYGFLSVFLLALIIYMIVRRVQVRKQKGTEKHNLSRLIGAKFVIIIPLITEILFDFNFEVVPFFSALAVLLIIISVVEGDLFNILDIGRNWVIENFDALFVIVDKSYGYLDSNKYAKEHFAGLSGIHKGEKLPEELEYLFLSSEEMMVIGNRHYKKFIRDLVIKDKVRGHAMILLDMTENYNIMEQLKESQLRA